MQLVNLNVLKDMISHVAVRMREPLMIWGPAGCGKSQTVAQSAAEHDAVLIDIRLSQYDSVDLRGIPVAGEGGLTTWCPPSTLPFVGNPAFPDTGLICLFLDEINSAAPSVAAVAYQLINDRAVGEHRLKDNVVILAAGNREEDRGVTKRMPSPLANRFTHVEIGVDVDVWCEHAQRIGLPAIGIAFMQFRKPLLHTFDPEKPVKSFATPRTWEKALRYYADTRMPENVRSAAIVGAVGEGPAAEFFGFVNVWKSLIPVEKIIQDPKNVPLPTDLSTRYAVAVSVSGAMSVATAAPLHTFLSRLDPEYAVLAWQLAVKRDSDLYTTDEFNLFAADYRAVFAG